MRAKDFLIVETRHLFEVDMSPSSLKKLASGISARAGMEFEMVVPNVETEEFSAQEDYDLDEPTSSIDHICDFFNIPEHNDSSAIERLQEILNSEYTKWVDEKSKQIWNTRGKEYLKRDIELEYHLLNGLSNDDISEIINEPIDNEPSQAQFNKLVRIEWENKTNRYQQSNREFKKEIKGEQLSEEVFLHKILNLKTMINVEDKFPELIRWPYWTDDVIPEQSIKQTADSFQKALGKEVLWATEYHAAQRSDHAYSLEPDISINAGPGEGGLEFISPPMPVADMIDDLIKVRNWAKENNCHTNESTGLHINVSTANYSREKLDFVKLAILMGDKYVLEQFGRLGNTYAKSALSMIEDNIAWQESQNLAHTVIQKLQNNMGELASKIIHNGYTQKYTSINVKDTYIEFRSVGGDWLNQKLNKIEDTMLRFVIAMDAACDPKKYQTDYYKALYKMLSPKKENDNVGMFAKYTAGEITTDEFINSIKHKRNKRLATSFNGDTEEKNSGPDFSYWNVINTDSNAQMQILARNRVQAISIARNQHSEEFPNEDEVSAYQITSGSSNGEA